MSHPSPINRCNFTFADGRRCRMPSIHDDEPLCHFHWEREHEKDDVARYGAQTLLPDHRRFDTARGINQALGRNYELLAEGRLPLRNSTALGYLASLMLQSVKSLRVEEPPPPPPDTTVEDLENEMVRNLGELMRENPSPGAAQLSPQQLRQEIRAILPPRPSEESAPSSTSSTSSPSPSLDSDEPIYNPDLSSDDAPLLDEATLRAVVPGYNTNPIVREYYSARLRPASGSTGLQPVQPSSPADQPAQTEANPLVSSSVLSLTAPVRSSSVEIGKQGRGIRGEGLERSKERAK